MSSVSENFFSLKTVDARLNTLALTLFWKRPFYLFFLFLFWYLVSRWKSNLFHFCLSSQGENEGTPSEKWGTQFDSLKIIGLCSIKAQRCSLWSGWLRVYLFICLSIHLFYRRSFASKRAAQTWQRRRIIESNVFASWRRRVPLWSDYLNECSSVVFKESRFKPWRRRCGTSGRILRQRKEIFHLNSSSYHLGKMPSKDCK